MPESEIPRQIGRYEIVRELGKGAMGIVYEGRDPIIGRRVAIKTARKDIVETGGRGPEIMERFLREARAAGTLSHPNIITIFEADEDRGLAYIAMEYIESGTLRDLIAQKRRLDPERIVAIGAAICNALALAHDQGIVHRDIKPANMMMLPDGSVKVADFGIAHVSDSNLTQEGSMIGTPFYMSPEQFMAQKVDGRSDLFSVGIILYELLTGERPFTGEALSTVMHQVLKVNPVPPHEFNYAVSESLSQVVMKALSKSPAKRYANGRAMAAALLESLKENPDPVVLGFAPGPEQNAATMALNGNTGITLTGTESGVAESVARLPKTPGAATMQTPPGTLPEDKPKPVAKPAASTMGRSRLKKQAALLVGAVVVAVVVGVYFFALRGDTPSLTRSDSAGQQGNGVDTPRGAGGNYIGMVDFLNVYLADTPEAYTDAEIRGDYTKCNANGRADLKVTDPETGALILKKEGVSNGPFPLPGKPRKIKVEFSKDGYLPIEEVRVAEGPEETFRIERVVLKKSPDG